MNILITRHDKIGDFITILPMLKILRQETSHNITVLVSPINYDLACSIKYIDNVIIYTKRNTLSLIKEIKLQKINTSISCYIDTRLALILFLSKIPTRISPATKFAQLFFNKTIKQKRSESKKTEWEYNIDLVKFFNPELNTKFKQPLLSFQHNKASASKLKIIAFHPGFGGSSQGNQTLDDYLRLARSIPDNNKYQIIFTFGPDDQKSKDYIQSKLDFDAEIVNSKLSLIEFCQLLNTFYLFVSTSTGPMHIAGALNKKTLSFFGDNIFASSARWAPVSDKKNQSNFNIPLDYDSIYYDAVEKKLAQLLSDS